MMDKRFPMKHIENKPLTSPWQKESYRYTLWIWGIKIEYYDNFRD